MLKKSKENMDRGQRKPAKQYMNKIRIATRRYKLSFKGSKQILELKDTATDLKHSLEGLSIRLEHTKEPANMKRRHLE